MDLGLEGKNALVCGASSGIGLAIAMKLAEEGCNITISSRYKEKLESARDKIREEIGKDVQIHPADLSSKSNIEALIDFVKGKYKTLDILVNNVGGPPTGEFMKIDEEQWFRSFESIFMSVVRLVKGFAPLFPGNGSIVNVLSRSAKEALPNLVISNAFRPALAGLAKTLSLELARNGVRINNVCPGAVMTQRHEDILRARALKENLAFEDIRARSESEIPLGRSGTPEEVASAAAYLCSVQASYITGASIFVDGGTMKSNI